LLHNAYEKKIFSRKIFSGKKEAFLFNYFFRKNAKKKKEKISVISIHNFFSALFITAISIE